MIRRILETKIAHSPKSLLLLGARQVGKSTLCRTLKPDLTIDLSDEEEFQRHLKDPGLLRRLVAARTESLILIDDVQRIPSLLNSVQAIVDRDKRRRFLLTGSSARKLRRGQANLLPGRVLIENLPPLVYWEIADRFDLERCLTVGSLPEVYLTEAGPEILSSYVSGYLREEIQAEALTKDLGAYSRFLDLAAELSGQYVNYAKIASDSEINKETIRRYFDILRDTLLIELIPSYKDVPSGRRARQKDRYIFFDPGVRNAILGRHKTPLSPDERGHLLEQWVILQCLYYQRLYGETWRISCYRDEAEAEVDMIIETRRHLIAIEIKASQRVSDAAFKGTQRFARLVKRKVEAIVVYCGTEAQVFEGLGKALPIERFLGDFLPAIE